MFATDKYKAHICYYIKNQEKQILEYYFSIIIEVLAN